MFPAIELPPPPIDLQNTPPGMLLWYTNELSYFASLPHRLAPHVALAAYPGKMHTVAAITEEFARVATPKVQLSTTATAYTRLRLGGQLGKSPYTTAIGNNDNCHDIRHTQLGRRTLPLISLLATIWVLAPELTEKLLPAKTKRLRNHGVRLACLQHCLYEPKSAASIMADLEEAPKSSVTTFLTEYERLGWISRQGNANNGYLVTGKARPVLAGLLTALHGLRDPEYSRALRAHIPNIVANRPLYGRLAHAALTHIQTTRRDD